MAWVLAQHLVVTALLAATVAVTCAVGRIGPATRHALWLVVLIKVLIPFPALWPWGVPTPWTSTFESSFSPPLSNSDANTFPASKWDQTKPETASAAGPLYRDYVFAISKEFYIAIAWGTTSIALLGLHVFAYARFKRKRRPDGPPPDWLAREVNATARLLAIKPPRTELVKGNQSPYVHGFSRPVLTLSSELVDAIRWESWRCVLIHELAHIKRRDHLIRWVEVFTMCVWFWNPLFWIVRRQLLVNAELACDAWVVAVLPEHRQSYANTLVDVTEFASNAVAPIGALGMGGRSLKKHLQRRLTMIMQGTSKPQISRLALAGTLILGLFALPGWSQQASELPEKFNAPVSLNFTNKHISIMLEFLADLTDTTIIIDQRVVKPRPRLAHPPSPPGAEKPAQPVEESNPALDALFVTNGMIESVELNNVPLTEALDTLLTPIELAYEYHDGILWVTSKARAGKESWGYPEVPSAETELAKKLEDPIAVEFIDQHFSRMLQFCAKYLKFEIKFDSRAVKQLIPSSSNTRVPAYIVQNGALSPTGHIDYFRAANVPFRSALTAILKPIDLTYAIGPGYLVVTTPEFASDTSYEEWDDQHYLEFPEAPVLRNSGPGPGLPPSIPGAAFPRPAPPGNTAPK